MAGTMAIASTGAAIKWDGASWSALTETRGLGISTEGATFCDDVAGSAYDITAFTSFKARPMAVEAAEAMLSRVLKVKLGAWQDYGDGWLGMKTGRGWMLVMPDKDRATGLTRLCLLDQKTSR